MFLVAGAGRCLMAPALAFAGKDMNGQNRRMVRAEGTACYSICESLKAGQP